MQKFYDLESCPLDKHVLVISRMVTNLDQEVDLLRNEASDNSNAIKNIEQTNQWTKTYLKQLSSAKADKTDVEDLAKSMNSRLNTKADKDEIEDLAKSMNMKIDELSPVMDSKLTLKADKCQIDELSNKVDQLSMESKSVKELSNKVDQLSMESKSVKVTTKTHWNLPEPVSIFFGRESLIESIHLKLQKNQAIALSEMGGVGKTQTAAKFLQMHKDEYQKIFWISAVILKRSLNEILCAFGCKQLIPDEPSMETLTFIFLSKFCEGSKGSLVVLDDVTEVTKDVTSLIRNVKEKISLLLTSQLRDWEDYGLIQIAVPCFQDQESIGFLQNELTTANHQEISILANRLQSLPLALQQAICYIKKHKVPLHKYIEQFEACRKSVLGMKINSFTEYDKTLLTVWDMAFAKIRVESNNALLILGMMALIDNRKINKKTFSYFDKVDEFELNEIINLLCQYSLVNERNECLEIHSLVQKVIRYRIEQKQFVEDECPLTLLEDVLLKIEVSIKDLFANDDYEDLWYIHVFRLIMSGGFKTINFNVSRVLTIAAGRMEMENLYRISELFLKVVLKQYRLCQDVKTFDMLLVVHRRFIYASSQLGLLNLNEIFAFEEEFSSELEEHSVFVYRWKLEQAEAYNIHGRVSLGEDIVQNLFNELVKKKGFDDVKLRLASFLTVRDVEVLLNSVDTNNLSDVNFLMYYYAKCSLYIENGCFHLAEQTMKNWKEHLHRKQFSRSSQFNFTKKNCFLLYKKGNYNEALLVCDELKRDIVFTNADVYISEALILIKLGKFNDAEVLLDNLNKRNNNGSIIRISSYLKFRKHDFEAVENLLTIVEDEDLLNILFLVKEYAKLHRQLENNKSREMVERCLQMKKIVNELFQVQLDMIYL
uniref:NB-ARC domain-containing protein n=1 Tax=Clytia hemisphaerica TaxID=252671 RepID=A0A7M5XGF8_9CNID